MQISRKMLIGLVLGAAVVGSIGSVAAQTDEPERSPSAGVEKAAGVHRGFGHGGPGRAKAIRSTAVLQPAEEGGEFRTVQSYAGTIESIDGNAITIEMADGQTAEVTVGDETTIRRDGEEAEIGDLEAGDHVRTHQVKEGDADFVTKHVRAISAERYAELEEKRRACEDDPSAENCGRRLRGPHGRRGSGLMRHADDPAAERSSSAA